MAGWQLIRKFTDTSPAAAGNAASGETALNCALYKWIRITAQITGGTGGTTQMVVQSKMAGDTWVEWASSAAVAAGVTTVYVFSPEATAVVSTVGITDDALTAYTPTLAAGTCVGGHPGDTVRLVWVAGVGTSAGDAQVVYLEGWRE